jgi:hypothetical protein
MYALAAFALLMIGLGSWMSWEAVEYFIHNSTSRNSQASAAAAASASFARLVPWEQETLIAFGQAERQAKGGNALGAERRVDEAVAGVEQARVRSKTVSQEFLGRASTELDGILKEWSKSSAAAVHGTGPSSTPGAPTSMVGGRLFQHVTQARVELAALRSWQEPIPPGSELALDAEEALQRQASQGPAANGAANAPNTPVGVALQAGELKLPAGHVSADGPRQLAANFLLDPASLGGRFLDASLMPDTSEILLPPETRKFADNVHVDNLTIAGASQTLDGIHWRNVTFIGTRLRYEDGQLDLQNVRFVHCTFGFPSDQRGAQIANAIIAGKTSLTIQ